VYYPELGEWVKIAWPDMFPVGRIERLRRKAGPLGFARMYLLDLMAAQGKNLKLEWLHEYPSEDIRDNWPVVMGVDYATTADKLKSSARDYFALSVGVLLPGGGIVLIDGFRAHLSQGEAEDKVKSWAGKYSQRVQAIGIENVTTGAEFFNRLLTSTSLPVIPSPLGNKGKGERFEKQMGPMFQMSRAWISDAPIKYLRDFRDEWAGWEAGAPHDDTLDATWHMLRTGVENLMPGQFVDEAELPVDLYDEDWSPFNSLGGQSGRL
jgi:hypothetical protein